jgi:DNA-binding LacI/PurR family transcriptional regulator
VPDGIVILNDLMTQSALATFRELGVRVNHDVTIATQSNKDSSILVGYESLLIRLEVDPAEVARALFQTLESLMQGEIPAEAKHQITPVVVQPDFGKTSTASVDR